MFYELVFIVRQDLSLSDVEKIRSNFIKIAEDNECNLIKTEYWGLRNLSYEIRANKKGYFIFLGLQAKPKAISEIERKMKFNDNIIRFLTIKVKKLNDEPSPIMKGRSSDDVLDSAANSVNV